MPLGLADSAGVVKATGAICTFVCDSNEGLVPWRVENRWGEVLPVPRNIDGACSISAVSSVLILELDLLFLVLDNNLTCQVHANRLRIDQFAAALWGE